MNDGIDALKAMLLGAGAFEAALTSPRKTPEDGVVRVDARVVEIKGERLVQIERRTQAQTFHKNWPHAEGVAQLIDMLPAFRQGVFTLPGARVHALTNRRGEVALREQSGDFAAPVSTHDKKKARVLAHSGWQRALGLVGAEGAVMAGMGDKLRQMDRFARIAGEAMAHVREPFEVIDLCCGKGYLTFAVAQVLKDAGSGARVTGMDLKGDVIKRLSAVARDEGLDNLTFIEGDVAHCPEPGLRPVVLSLHACDTATDIVLANAVRWQAPLILCAPCCQHELRGQVDNELLRPLLKHGLFKERYAALLTDALRCALLESHGYGVDVLEFIDPEHTPKNTLIRASRVGSPKPDGAYETLRAAMGVRPALERLLEGDVRTPED